MMWPTRCVSVLLSRSVRLAMYLDTVTEAVDWRFFDFCTDGGWLLLHPGAPEGGCVIQLGILVCNVPSERYMHASALFDDGTMYIYGGFSQRCQDYCDDLWMFDLFLKGWRELYSSSRQQLEQVVLRHAQW